MAKIFSGALTALITPFKNNQFDREAMDRLIEQQISAGIDGLVPCGTTGEGATMQPDEQAEIVRFVVERVAGRVPVIAGAGANSTQRAIELQKRVKEAGADGALQVTPYYNKPNQRGLQAHFLAIVEAAPLPTLLYNVPGRTSCDLLPASVAELAKNPHIVGIKDATGSAARAQALRNVGGDDFCLFSGEDAFILPFMALGGDGVISVMSHVAPASVAAMIDAIQAQNWAQARRLAAALLPLADLMFVDTNPIPVKTACAAMGLCEEEFRLPLLAMEDEQKGPFIRKVRQLIQALKSESLS